MLDSDYIQQVKIALKNSVKHANDHQIDILTSRDENDAYLTYTPDWVDNPNDNDGQLTPVHRILIQAIPKAKSPKWNYLVNNYYIHAQKFSDNDYQFNFNYRNDNAISEKGVKQLASDLKQKFGVTFVRKGKFVGALMIKITKHVAPAFLSMIQAIQYLHKNGYKYTTSDQQSDFSVTKDLEQEQDAIKDADHAYQVAKRKHSGSSKRKPKRRRAPGRIRSAFSSTNGTPEGRDRARREKAKEAKLKRRAKQRKKHPKRTSAKAKLNIKGNRFTTCGRFSMATSKLKKWVTKHGGKIQASVNSKTNYLICNKPSKSKKYQQAKKQNVKIINEKQLLNAKH